MELNHRGTKIMGTLDGPRPRGIGQLEVVGQLDSEALRRDREPLDEVKRIVDSAVLGEHERRLLVPVRFTHQMLDQLAMYDGGELKQRFRVHAPSSKRLENPLAHETRL
jgi:hypothetical protein